MTDLFDQSQPRPPRGIALEVEFGAFWPLYPRHVARKKAYEAFKAARRQHSIETIMGGVQRYAAHVQGIEMQYILHASTWLNGERWDDDLVPRGSGQPMRGTDALRQRLRTEIENGEVGRNSGDGDSDLRSHGRLPRLTH